MFSCLKKIGGHTYTIISDKWDRNDPAYFYSLHIREDGETLSPEQVSLGQQAMRAINANTADFWIDFQGGKVFTLQVLFQPDGQFNNAVTGVFETDLNKIEDLTDDKVKLLTTFSDSFLSTSSLLLFDPPHASLLIEQGGGDGCGGGGTIYSLSLSGQKTEVASHAYGCVDSGRNPPIFGGVIGQQLVFADTNIEQIDGEQVVHLKNIYELNPFTRERKTIVSDPDILANIVLVYRETNLVSEQLSDEEILVEKKTTDASRSGFYALNFVTKELRKIEELPTTDASP